MKEVLYNGRVYRIIKEADSVITISRFLDKIEVNKEELTFL